MKKVEVDVSLEDTVDKFLKEKCVDNRRGKIKGEAREAVFLLRKKGALYREIKLFLEEVYGISVTVSAIAGMIKRQEKPKRYVAKETVIKKEQKAIVEQSGEDSGDNAKEGFVEQSMEDDNIVVIDGVRYKKKKRLHNSGDEEIEKKIDEREEMFNRGEIDIRGFKIDVWNWYVRRYIEDEGYYKCSFMIDDEDFNPNEIPKKYFGQFFRDFVDLEKEVKHLEKID